ncbi:hypothetical protein C456_01332 [Haloferax volcanii DSM 14919]|nr:hypothetical protein C456_01332 [Haloferax lucentense DSM 14919]
MHQIIYALVTASTTDQALSRTADVFDQHYVTVDDDSTTVAGSARWGDLPVAEPVDSEDGQELLERGWQVTTREFERNLERVREGVDDLDAAAIMRDEDLLIYACHNLGAYRGPVVYLYDEFADGVRHRERLSNSSGRTTICGSFPLMFITESMLCPMVLLSESFPDRGIAVRIVVDDAADSYRVEYTPLSGGVVTDEWTVFGGVSECKQACSCNT